MHMSDCLGGYDFFDEEHLEEISEPRLVNRGQVTKDIFDKKYFLILFVQQYMRIINKSKILIMSKLEKLPRNRLTQHL